MATNDLTGVSILARKAVRYSIYFVIFYFIGRAALSFAFMAYRAIFPKAPPPPTVGFSVLPKIPFPKTQGEVQVQYELETTTGELPKLPTTMKVYSSPKSTVQISSLSDAKEEASAFGFLDNPIEISQVIYRFSHQTKPSYFEINIVSGVFSISYNLSQDPGPLSGEAPSAGSAIGSAMNFLSQGQKIPDDIDTEGAKVVYIKSDNGVLINALSESDAELARVNMFRKPIEEDNNSYPSVTSDPSKANIWFLISGSKERNSSVIAAEYHYFPVSYDVFETYPIKTAQEAFDELSQGGGYIANLGAASLGKVKVRNIYLGYFDSNATQEFYQPVVVFEGDGGFMAYVPAVTSKYYGE